ncbi:unnamed protein product, partial [Symbiodinium sp. KB8]
MQKPQLFYAGCDYKLLLGGSHGRVYGPICCCMDGKMAVFTTVEQKAFTDVSSHASVQSSSLMKQYDEAEGSRDFSARLPIRGLRHELAPATHRKRSAVPWSMAIRAIRRLLRIADLAVE